MAKKKAAHPIHMHVPTKIGLTVVGIAVMVYGVFLAAAYTQNNQTQMYTHAATIITPDPIRKTTPTPIKRRPTPTPIKRRPTPTGFCHIVCTRMSGHLCLATTRACPQ